MIDSTAHIRRSADAHESAGGLSQPDSVDVYVDGGLDEVQRREFERRIELEPALRLRVEAAREADAWLRSACAPPDEAAVAGALALAMSPASIPIGAAGRASRGRRRWLGYGIAAALALAAAAAWQLGLLPGATGGDPAMRIARGDGAAWFDHVVSSGFKPEWVRKDDAELARYTREKFGNAWTIDPAPELKLVGWTYTGRVLEGEYSSVLLARWEDRPVALVVDSLQNDRTVRPADDGSVGVHRRELCDIVIYEISSLGRPVILDRIQFAPR